jgi:hypothetical protein
MHHKFPYYLLNLQKLSEMRTSVFNSRIITLRYCSTNWLAGLNVATYLIKARTVEHRNGNGRLTRNNGVTVGICVFCEGRVETILFLSEILVNTGN